MKKKGMYTTSIGEGRRRSDLTNREPQAIPIEGRKNRTNGKRIETKKSHERMEE